jgi:nicotinamidase/pyrazinamidase
MGSQGDTQLQATDALIIVDVQNDFLPGGSLAVPNGDEVVPTMNNYSIAFKEKKLPIFATRDWHPANHCSFKAQGGIWPPHCVQGSQGGEFASDLQLPEEAVVISTATDPKKEAYSGFHGTDLHDQLQALGVKRLFIGGLATDYCVLSTVKDGLSLGYEVYLLEDASRAVNVNPHDGQKAIAEMVNLGAIPMNANHLV